MPANTNYVSIDRLNDFLTTLKGKYSGNTASADDKWKVGYAQHALMDTLNREITATYATLSDVQHNISTINITVPTGAPAGSKPSNNTYSIDLSGYALKSDIAAAMNFRGSKTGAELRAFVAGDVSNGDVYSCTSDDATGSPVFHAGYEYAVVKTEAVPAQGEEGEPGYVPGTPASISWVELGKYLDLSGYIDKASHATYSGKIAVFGSNGDISGTVDASVLGSGSVTTGDTHYVTGGQVAAVTDALEGRINQIVAGTVVDVKTKIDNAAATSIVNTNTHEAVIYVTASATSASNDLITSGGVYSAISGLSTVYSRVENASGTQITTLVEASSSDVSGLFTAIDNPS